MVKLSDIKAVAARSQYLLRVTLDYVYTPYNNWSCVAGQSATELAQLIAVLETWPRNRLWIEQPAGYFIPCEICDLKTLAWLMFQANGWCKVPAFIDPPVVCTSPSQFVLAPNTTKITTPTGGVNLPSYFLTTEGGSPIVADNGALIPCYRDWVALGLGPPPKPVPFGPCPPPQFNPW